MSYYYEYKFTSPEKIYAIVKEEFKSYFDTGAVDDLMFPTYVNKCLNKLGKSTYVMREVALFIDDFECRLPDNFYAVREAWLCSSSEGYPYQSPNSFYSQTVDTIQIAPMTVNGEVCGESVCQPDACNECLPLRVQAVYKTNTTPIVQVYVRQYLLKPGNISARAKCTVDYMGNWEEYSQVVLQHRATPYSSGYDSFDIRDNKFVTNFRTGVVDMIFYATDYDKDGNQLVPDNYYIMEYIEMFIKYKVFESLLNQTTDETFNQIERKLVYYKQLTDEAFIIANSEIRKPTIWQKHMKIKSDLKKFDKYELPGSTNRGRYYR